MTTTPLFIPTPDGKAYDIAPAGVMLILADTIHSHDPEESTPAGRARARNTIQAMLTAASKGGYLQCGVLETLLARNERSMRVQAMARAACHAAGNEAIGEIFAAMRKEPK